MNTQCSIPITTLLASPFNLLVGDSVYASVIAINDIGPSPQSAVGNGAIIAISTVPDAPKNLIRDLNVPLS